MLNSILHESDALTVIRGESKTLRLEVTEEDRTGAEVPTDITGAVIYLTVKVLAVDNKALIHKSSTEVTEIEITNPLSGVAFIYLLPEDTFYLDPGDYVFDVWVRYTSTEKRFPVVRNSTFRVVSGVSRIPLP